MGKQLKKKVSLIILVLLILDIPFILYLLNLKSVAFNEEFYKKEFLKYDIYDEFPGDDIEVINSELLYYLRYDKTNNYVGIDLFDEREKQHLYDVKELVQKSLLFLNAMIMLFIILIIALIFIDKKNSIKKISLALIYGGAVTFLDAFVFFIIVKLNFGGFFDIFHKTFFQDGTWLFDEGTEMVTLYTANLFYDATLTIVVWTLVIALIIILSGLFILYKRKIWENMGK